MAAPLIALAVRDGWSLVVIPLLVVAGAGHASGFSPLVERLAATAGPGRASAVSGFADQAHLCRAVRAELGHTPTELRLLLGP